MKLSSKLGISLVVFTAFTSNAYAALCSTDSFTLTSIVETGGGDSWTGSIDSTRCVGLYSGNDDQYGQSEPNPNIGLNNVGFLNGQGLSQSDVNKLLGNNSQRIDLTDDGVNNPVDPGWIHLANIQGLGSPVPNTSNPGGEGDYDYVEGIYLGDYLDITFTANTWEIVVAEGTADFFNGTLGLLGTFDHLTFTVKSSTYYGVWDLDFTEIAPILDGQGFTLDFLEDYTFAGMYNMADFDFKDVSHINVWARDPHLTSVVPVPAAVWLFGSAILGFAGFNRFKKKS